MLLIFCCDLINYNNISKKSKDNNYKTSFMKMKFVNNKFIALFTVEYIGGSSNLGNFDDNSQGYTHLKNWFHNIVKPDYIDMKCLTSNLL